MHFSYPPFVYAVIFNLTYTDFEKGRVLFSRYAMKLCWAYSLVNSWQVVMYVHIKSYDCCSICFTFADWSGI